LLQDLARDDMRAAERLLRHFLGLAPPARQVALETTNNSTTMGPRAIRGMIGPQRGA
jgi:hypothetical protein